MKKIIGIFFLSMLIGGESWPQSLPDVSTIKDSTFQMTNYEFSLVVDYSKTVAQMIVAGKYDWKNSTHIKVDVKDFPLPVESIGKKVVYTVKFFHFDRDMPSKDIIDEMAKSGYCPAAIAELLTVGKDNPKLQRRFTIVAFGSILRDDDGGRVIPAIGSGNGGRGLATLNFEGCCWNCKFNYLFLAVRKQP